VHCILELRIVRNARYLRLAGCVFGVHGASFAAGIGPALS
jgi:hypothetical protein